MKLIALVPARMRSQRLKKKNLQLLGGIPLITRAIRKCVKAGVFDEIWVNSEHTAFKKIAEAEGVSYHRRPEDLSNDSATSEQYVYEFLKSHSCDFVVQVHSIAPLLSYEIVRDFSKVLKQGEFDVLLSVFKEQIECLFKGKPVNFEFEKKMNSQELVPDQRITWGITGWRSRTYIKAFESGRCATFSGKIGVFPVDRLSGHVIKTQDDLDLAEIFLSKQEEIKD